MSENTSPRLSNTHAHAQPARGGVWVSVLLLLGIALIFAVSMMVAPRAAQGEEAFGGTDAAVSEMLEQDGVEPWFSPVLELASGELESGLFALQAALGAGLFGFVLGRLSARSKHREVGSSRPTDVPGPPA